MGMKFLEENLLDHLQRPEFSELLADLTQDEYPRNSFICQPGIGDDRIFIITQGRARVYLGYEEKEFNLGILTRGDIYSTHTGTFVQALDNLSILTTDVRTFRKRMVTDPEVTKAMVRVLGNILKNSFAIIDGLAFKDVNCRLTALLCNEASRHGVTSPSGGVQFRLDLSMEQIARLVGSSRQTVSTLINDLERAGLIARPDRGVFSIPDIEALRSIGGVG